MLTATGQNSRQTEAVAYGDFSSRVEDFSLCRVSTLSNWRPPNSSHLLQEPRGPPSFICIQLVIEPISRSTTKDQAEFHIIVLGNTHLTTSAGSASSEIEPYGPVRECARRTPRVPKAAKATYAPIKDVPASRATRFTIGVEGNTARHTA